MIAFLREGRRGKIVVASSIADISGPERYSLLWASHSLETAPAQMRRWRLPDGRYRPSPTVLWALGLCASGHPTPPDLLALFDTAPRGQVYFIQAGHRGPVKIGSAAHAVDRLRSMQTSHHEALRLLASIDGGFGTEKEMHQRFAKYQIKREWFNFRGELKKFVTALQKQQRDEPH